MNDTYEIKIDGLDKLIRVLQKNVTGSIGVLAGKNARMGDGSNATIGMKHEFGDPKEGLPIRSWLRMPIIEHLEKNLEKADAFTDKTIKEVVKEGSIVPWMKKVMVTAEGCIADAFDTGGFGKWKPSNMVFKKNKQTLVETQQLRNSVTSEVKLG